MKKFLGIALGVGLLIAAIAMPTASHAAARPKNSGYCPAGTCPQFCNANNYANNVKNCSAANCKKCKTENKR